MNLKIANVVKYAAGTAPFVGIPIEGDRTIVMLRQHLQSALATQPSHVTFNFDTHILTIRNHRSEWKLNDLLGLGKVQRWQIQQQHASWAQGKRSGARARAATKALGKEGVYIRRLREAIVKLTKQRDKIYLRPLVSPLIHERRMEAHDYSRNEAKRWADEKPIRKALAKIAGRKLFHGEPKTWADFYRAVESISGRPVSESATFTRVHGRKRYRHGLPDYPDREDYLKALPIYLGMASKPWDRRPYDLYKKDEYGEQLNALERHGQARREYCATLRERMALDSQIAAHLAEIEQITAGLDVV